MLHHEVVRNDIGIFCRILSQKGIAGIENAEKAAKEVQPSDVLIPYTYFRPNITLKSFGSQNGMKKLTINYEKFNLW